jgi:hypothetical protein
MASNKDKFSSSGDCYHNVGLNNWSYGDIFGYTGQTIPCDRGMKFACTIKLIKTFGRPFKTLDADNNTTNPKLVVIQPGLVLTMKDCRSLPYPSQCDETIL